MTTAVKNPDRLGLVFREFRTVTLPSGHRLSNVMFLEPDMEKVAEIMRDDLIPGNAGYEEKAGEPLPPVSPGGLIPV